MKLYNRTVNDIAPGGANSDGGVSSQYVQYQTSTALQNMPLISKWSMSRAADRRFLGNGDAASIHAECAAAVRRETPVTANSTAARGSTNSTSARSTGTKDCDSARN